MIEQKVIPRSQESQVWIYVHIKDSSCKLCEYIVSQIPHDFPSSIFMKSCILETINQTQILSQTFEKSQFESICRNHWNQNEKLSIFKYFLKTILSFLPYQNLYQNDNKLYVYKYFIPTCKEYKSVYINLWISSYSIQKLISIIVIDKPTQHIFITYPDAFEVC